MNNQLTLFGYKPPENGAKFSDCRKYRFVLWRIWDYSLETIMFIGLNPSTANEVKQDNTINRIKGLTKDLGYGGFYMLNLFTFITAYPKELKNCENPTLEADKYLLEYSSLWSIF